MAPRQQKRLLAVRVNDATFAYIQTLREEIVEAYGWNPTHTDILEKMIEYGVDAYREKHLSHIEKRGGDGIREK